MKMYIFSQPNGNPYICIKANNGISIYRCDALFSFFYFCSAFHVSLNFVFRTRTNQVSGYVIIV